MNPTSDESVTIGLAAGPDDERGEPVALSAPPQLELNGSSQTPTRLLSGATEADLALVKDRLQAAGYGQEKILAVWGVSDANKELAAEGITCPAEVVPVLCMFGFVLPCTLPCIAHACIAQSQKRLVKESVADSTLYVLSEHTFFRVHRDWAPRPGSIEFCFVHSGVDLERDLATGAQPLNAITGVAVDSGLKGADAREWLGNGEVITGAAQVGVRLKVPAGSALNKQSWFADLDRKKFHSGAPQRVLQERAVAGTASKYTTDTPGVYVRPGYENSFLVACESAGDAAKIIEDAWEHAKRVDGVPPEIMQQQMEVAATARAMTEVAATARAMTDAQLQMMSQMNRGRPMSADQQALVMRQHDQRQQLLAAMQQGTPQTQQPEQKAGEGKSGSTVVEKMKELNDLYGMGLISATEFEEKKKELMGQL